MPKSTHAPTDSSRDLSVSSELATGVALDETAYFHGDPCAALTEVTERLQHRAAQTVTLQASALRALHFTRRDDGGWDMAFLP